MRWQSMGWSSHQIHKNFDCVEDLWKYDDLCFVQGTWLLIRKELMFFPSRQHGRGERQSFCSCKPESLIFTLASCPEKMAQQVSSLSGKVLNECTMKHKTLYSRGSLYHALPYVVSINHYTPYMHTRTSCMLCLCYVHELTWQLLFDRLTGARKSTGHILTAAVNAAAGRRSSTNVWPGYPAAMTHLPVSDLQVQYKTYSDIWNPLNLIEILEYIGIILKDSPNHWLSPVSFDEFSPESCRQLAPEVPRRPAAQTLQAFEQQDLLWLVRRCERHSNASQNTRWMPQVMPGGI